MPKRFRMVELFVVLALVLAGTTYYVAVRSEERRLNDRIRCAKTLKGIGQSILLYTSENRGRWPRTRMSNDDYPKAVWGTPYDSDSVIGPLDTADPFANMETATPEQRRVIPADNDITAAMWLLLRTQDLVPEAFVCPASNQTPWDMGGKGSHAKLWTNWKGRDVLRRHLSYSMLNPYRSPAMMRADGTILRSHFPFAETPTLSDMNPGSPAVSTVLPQSPQRQMREANSRNHRGEGQNVLFGDGHVEFMSTPFCGEQLENIFRIETPLTTQPTRFFDSILLPTAADLDPG